MVVDVKNLLTKKPLAVKIQRDIIHFFLIYKMLYYNDL